MVVEKKSPSRSSSNRKKPSRANTKKVAASHSPKEEQQPYELFDDVINKISDYIFILTDTAKLSYANKQVMDRLGFASKDIQDAPITKFLLNMKQDAWLKTVFKPAKESKKEHVFQWKFRTVKKKIFTLEIKVVFFVYQGEDFLFCTGREAASVSNKDLKGSQNSESAQKRANSLYQNICESAVEAIFVLDTKGNVVYANAAVEPFVGKKPSDYVGSHFKEILAPASSKSTASIFKGALKGESVQHEELTARDKDGNLVLADFSATPIYENKKVVQVQFILRNLNERKNLQESSDEEEKMKAVQSFIKGTVQEIQKPLEGLLTQTEKLIKKYTEKDFEYIGHREFSDLLKGMNVMCDQIRYCSETTSRLVDINKTKAGLNKSFSDCNVSVKEALKMVKTHLDLSDIEVKQFLGRNLPPVAVGETELVQILSNVFTNAIQSIRGKGLIRVKTRLNKADDRIYFEFSDNGVGMSKETLERVFEPFFTTKQRGLEKSSGLGLSTVYATVKKINGDIKIQSSLRRGTRVQLFLPVFKEENTENTEKVEKATNA